LDFDEMIEHFVLFFAAAVFSLIFAPLIRAFAVWAKILDIPSERKVHAKPVPLLGGIPIFLSFNLVVILGIIQNQSYLKEPVLSKWQTLLICQIIILGLGLFDDIIHVQPGTKLIFQIFVGVLIFLFGFGINNITNPFNGSLMHLGLLSLPITVFWLVLITNALNLVDGLDGLAAGTALIVAMTIFAISFFNQSKGIAFISIVLAGSILGFLRYNFYPAKIFLGDTGSMLLGFLLAVTSIQGSSKGATLVAVLAPILALGFPIMETLLSMIRRLLRSIHVIDYSTKNGRSRVLFFRNFTIFEADKDHVHHRLLKFGFSQRKAVIVLYAICIGLSILAFLSVALKNLNIIAVLGAIFLAFLIGIKSLKYQEFKILENGLLIPLFSFPVINKSLFQAFLDLVMISFSFYLSFVLVFKDFGQAKDLFLKSLPLVLLIKVVVFYLSSLYRGSWVYSSIEDALTILKATILSSLSVVIILSLFFSLKSFGGAVFFILDFYLLLSLVAGFRVSYKIFNSFYKQGSTSKGKKILIYGAGYRGSTVLKEIRNNDTYSLSPAGFIDDAPEKLGKNMHGIPILGTIEDLDSIFEDNEISEIIISTAKIGKEKIRRLTEFCKAKNIIIRQFEFRFYEFP
jgi:UDP-GlcNAc:undecaprenyl-phosphate/decaprenyl-phosphate GlcNAc-1-phosphate transferase